MYVCMVIYILGNETPMTVTWIQIQNGGPSGLATVFSTPGQMHPATTPDKSGPVSGSCVTPLARPLSVSLSPARTSTKHPLPSQ